MLSEKKLELLETIANLRKQVDLLDSHKTVGLINNKQYDESLKHIMEKIEKIEEENGIEPPKDFTAFDLLFGDSMDKFNDMMTSFDVLVGKK